MNKRTPKYRLHKATGQAVVTLSGRDHYLGPHGAARSEAEYDRLVAEWLQRGRTLPATVTGSDITINELAVQYLAHADGYYLKDGKPTKEPGNIRLAVRSLRKLYGHTLAKDFGPLALKTVRQHLIADGLTRTGINMRIDKIRRMFKWGSSEELVPTNVYQALKDVQGLTKGRSKAKEGKRVLPVEDRHVDAVLPYVSRQVAAMIQLQRLTGCRSGEIVIMRTMDIDRSSETWTYTPSRHKTEHHDRARVIHLGPQAQAILKGWLRDGEPTAYLFSPAEAMAEHRDALRKARQTKVQPSQQNRAKRGKRRKQPGESYRVESYRRAITSGITKANQILAERGEPLVPHWHPHQIRHAVATKVQNECGLEVARCVLGHSSPVTTAAYAERDEAAAAAAMKRMG